MKPKIRKKREKRIDKSLLVNISQGGYEELGLTSNISKNGLFIAAPEVFPDKQELSVWIAVGNDIFQVKGEVRWSIQSSGTSAGAGNLAGGMGIKIRKAPEEFRKYVENLKFQKKRKCDTPAEEKFAGRKSG
jgi:hypothetical protein